MSPSMPGPTAALAGIPAGIQSQGVWMGRRQLFVRFAAEAETATMYTADALANEISRALKRSTFHSICIAGRDPLANVEYIVAAFTRDPGLLTMVDCDGQRPEGIEALRKHVRLVQVTVEVGAAPSDALVDKALESVRRAGGSGMDHALVLVADERASDSILLRIVEQAHAASDATQVVIHPGSGVPVDRDRRWPTLLERAAQVHGEVRFTLRLPPPTGMR